MQVNVLAFYCFEWLVTFDQEVTHIWARKWSLSTWVFAINRHVTLLAVILQILPAPNNDALTVLQFLAIARLRASAICHRSIWVFVVVFVLSGVPVVVNMVLFVKEDPLFLSGPTGTVCTVFLPFSDSVILKLALITRGAVVAADIIVLAVTWKETIGTVREAARLDISVPLSEILIRDALLQKFPVMANSGALTCLRALLAINIIQILANTVASLPEVLRHHSNTWKITSLGSPYSNLSLSALFLIRRRLTAIIVSRFILNLRQAVKEPGMPNNTTNRSTIHFNSDILVGDLGQSLKFGAEYDESDLMVDDSGRTVEGSEYFKSTGSTAQGSPSEDYSHSVIEGTDWV
ncbi:hypothetical protein BDY19DRAFT_909283 [Irpex rosettiformis]|uniref:Uncharacterized protein n=1 Tax=Irpex rosettiformis TaxID=378272 RepID=A0ACB8TT71_9APHY|nr:hypothetical protein BDY19DRAFT_909283 [Irpex rosettiformis]